MTLRSTAAAIVLFTVTAAFGQENAPESAPASSAAPQSTHPPIVTHRWGRNANGNTQSGPANASSPQKRVDELQGTVDKMHAVLKQMRAKSTANAKDPMVKANLEMWDLMIGQLDKQLQELKQAEASRQDMEARRAAMYKQAEIKSQAAPRAGQQTMSSQQPTGAADALPAAQGPSGQVPAATPAPAPSSSPNASASPN